MYVFHWNHNATLDLLTTYNAIMQPDKENIKKQKFFSQVLAIKLQILGYNVSIM